MITVNIQSSIRIEDGSILYFDPLKVEEKHDADYIFITHPHWDHFNLEDILKVKKDTTKIIAPKSMEEELMSVELDNLILLEPNEEKNTDDISVKAVRAYNNGKQFHLKENNWLGYCVTLKGETYYIPGDTDDIEENQNIHCTILFVPIGGTYTMDYKEAAEFTNRIKPKKVIPIHYNMAVGSKEDEEEFKKLLNSEIICEIQI